MAKITQEQRTEGKPQLKPDAVGNADVLVVTVAEIDFKDSQFRGGKQPVLTFKEFPNHEWRVGKRSLNRICEQLGEETDDWKGERIPLIKAREEVGKATYVVFQAAPPEEWTDLLKKRGKK